jgi:hypothetical protein
MDRTGDPLLTSSFPVEAQSLKVFTLAMLVTHEMVVPSVE